MCVGGWGAWHRCLGIVVGHHHFVICLGFVIWAYMHKNYCTWSTPTHTTSTTNQQTILAETTLVLFSTPLLMHQNARADKSTCTHKVNNTMPCRPYQLNELRNGLQVPLPGSDMKRRTHHTVPHVHWTAQ